MCAQNAKYEDLSCESYKKNFNTIQNHSAFIELLLLNDFL